MINYALIIKPGIILGNLLTFTAGFLLATHGEFNLFLYLSTLFGLGCIIASACICNNMIDCVVDQKMERTRNRPLASGALSRNKALLFALLLALLGNGIFLMTTNLLTTLLANTGFIIYVFIYSFIKTKTVHSTLIGSLAGALPPVIGYCAVSNRLDLAAALLFFMMVLWQMPHFFAIGLWRYEDYSKAGIPILPVSEGAFRTKIEMLLYIVFLVPTLVLMTFMGLTGELFLVTTSSFALAWLAYALLGFSTKNNSQWARQMFRLSLLMISAISLLSILDRV